jgi:5-methylcytosine-specific restriction endonuclease McrA
MKLLEQLRKLAETDRRITGEILELIRRVDQERLYLDWGYPSLFAFLTKELLYTPGAAQRRIEAARLLREIPSLRGDLQSGALNLSQVALVAQATRNLSLTAQEKADLLRQVKGLDLKATQVVIAKALDQPIRMGEKERHQKDESVLLELTLSKEQMAALQRVKELISHTHPNPSYAELLALLAEDFLRRKDPRRERKEKKTGAERPRAQSGDDCQEASQDKGEAQSASTSAPVAGMQHKPQQPRAADIRAIHQRDRCCQWRDPRTGEICGSTFQLQVDHIQSRSAGGGHERENLQLLCAVHNRLKWEKFG